MLDLARGLLRGRYMVAAARIENNGIPIDTDSLSTIRKYWKSIQARLIERINRIYGVFEYGSFRIQKWEEWLIKNNIPWPRLPTGHLAMDDSTFKDMVRAHPIIAPLRELRVSISQMRLLDLAVGSDGRNRALLSTFRSKTSRNQPSNTKFIFGPAVWLRNLIKPFPDSAIAYIDWSQQEFGIAAALSRDPAMMEAYSSGDCYLAFAKQAKVVPPDGTKTTHKAERDLFKACILGTQYGMGEAALATRINRPLSKARELLKFHREVYPKFWRWSDAVVDTAMAHGKIWTVYGWPYYVGKDVNPRSLRNFPMQANGAEMMRLACCLATERGIRIAAPVHDALMIESSIDQIDVAVKTTQEAMAEASRIVLGGFELRSDANVVAYPNRYQDERGQKMWDMVWEIIRDLEAEQPAHERTSDLTAGGPLPVHQRSPVLSTSSLIQKVLTK